MKIDFGQNALSANNLSIAWAYVLLELTKPGVKRIAPLTLQIRGFASDGMPAEVPAIRAAVDTFTESQGVKDSENVAFTIFPQRYLDLAGGDRQALYELYIESFQRIQKFNPRNNKRGSYFQRLIDFNGQGQGPNQLEWMIQNYHAFPKSRRSSKFQATTFDPARDQKSDKFLEFPCLQQVSFTFDDTALHLNAFYATQQIARKAYGNYLGLSRLGAFMASQMGLRLEQINVFVGAAQMDVKKSDKDLKRLLEAVKTELGQTEPILAAA